MLVSREVILFGLNSTYQQDPGLTAAAHAVLVESPSWANEGVRMYERPAVKPTFGKRQPRYAGGLKKVSFGCEVKGSGAAGTAPEIGALLQVCALAENVVADTSVTYARTSTPSAHKDGTLYYYQDGLLRKLYGVRGTVSFALETGGKMMANFELTGHEMCWGTAQAGAATTITLASTSAATDDVYNGQTVSIIAGPGAGQSRTISDYVGATKIATVAAWDTNPDDTSVYKIDGGPYDAAIVSPTYDSTVPVPLVGVPFSIGSYAACISKLELSLGNVVSMSDCISSPDGYGEIRVTNCEISGSFDPEATLVATKAWEAEWKAGTQQAIDTGTIGTTAGNRVRLQVPYSYYTDISMGDREGARTYEIPFGAEESSGDDQFSLIFT